MFTGKLYDAQKPAAEFICNKKRALLSWEQGTGKTIISIAAAEKLIWLGKAKRVLILVPPSFAWQWEEKINEFSTRGVTLVTAKDKAARTYRPRKGCAYYVVPYSLFRRDFNTIFARDWDIVIADEAQEFRNFRTKTYKLMLGLNRKCKPTYRWALTGTAIGNKLEELYAIFQWIDPKFLPSWPAFEKAHVVRNNLGIISGYKNLKQLNEYLQARMNRKTHDDLKGKMPTLLPDQVHKLPASKTYKREESKLLALLDDVAGNLRFDDDGKVKEGPRDKRIAKQFHKVREQLEQCKYDYSLQLIEHLLEENPDNRIVVFSAYKDPLYRLGHELGSRASFFTGDQSPEAKRDSILRIKKGDSRVLLASNAAKAGVDIPWANIVINLDVPPSFEVKDQRIKRVVRAGSNHSYCIAIYLVVENSIEEYYYNLVTNKGRLASGAMEGTEDEVIMRESSLRKFIDAKR